MTNEAQLDKTNKTMCAPSKDSDPPRLICVFAGCTGHFAGFAMQRLKSYPTKTDVVEVDVGYDININGKSCMSYLSIRLIK